MFLQDADFESDADLAALQGKLNQIRSFTASLFLDVSDKEKHKYQNVKERLEQLKESLFTNSDSLLEKNKLGIKDPTREAMKEAQINLMFDWEQFGLTEDMFLKMYQCQRNKNSSDPQTNKRAMLLTEILVIQTDLLLLFKIRQG
jgi:hypothetical protein